MRKPVNKYGSEEVFIVPFRNLQHINSGYTWEPHNKDIWTKFDKLGKYVYRDDAEGIYVLQQIKPFIILKNELGEYLAYSHEDTTTERTSNKMSIGFESHITPKCGMNNALFKCSVDILIENNLLDNTNINPLKFVGYVRDMVEPNADQIGCVFVFECTNFESKAKEAKWMSRDDLIASYHKFESWSKFIIDHLVDNITL